MTSRETILAAIYAAIDCVNPQLEKSLRLAKAEQTLLLGNGSPLDSMGLITLIVEVEQAVQDGFGKSVNLAEALADSGDPARSPLRSVAALADYLHSQVEGS